MKNIKAYASKGATELLDNLTIQRREILENDIEMEILYCGICHSDLHQLKNDF
jgi:uncharacterized zinc-type alcohol dehydrogenase-like protein